MIKLTIMNKCASVVGHFDGHADALKQCTWHCPMQQIQGYTRCPWKPPSGNYSLRIAPAAARATINKTTIKQYTHFAGSFDGHCNEAVRFRAQRPIEEVQGFTRSHWMPPLGEKSDRPTPVFSEFFHRQLAIKGIKVTSRTLITIGV
jgi:hypothetical protein